MFDFKKLFIDLLFPIECLGCGEKEHWLCPACSAKIEIKFKNQPEIFAPNQSLTGVWLAADYRQPLLIKVLHTFKYSFVVCLGQDLAEVLIRFLSFKIKQKEISGFDLVIAIPLAKRRRLWRGFNQAEILAAEISRHFSWSNKSDLLFRKYYNRPQVGLKAVDRIINVKGIFCVQRSDLLKNKKVLLIDDVVTTGATMQECAKVIKEAGAKEIWGLAVARG
ncbi:MAG: phosphoribosyltransferase family protein [Patescibacteria group bacterium]|jgi:ComF family protein